MLRCASFPVEFHQILWSSSFLGLLLLLLRGAAESCLRRKLLNIESDILMCMFNLVYIIFSQSLKGRLNTSFYLVEFTSAKTTFYAVTDISQV
jgi:hypothetical protein